MDDEAEIEIIKTMKLLLLPAMMVEQQKFQKYTCIVTVNTKKWQNTKQKDEQSTVSIQSEYSNNETMWRRVSSSERAWWVPKK